MNVINRQTHTPHNNIAKVIYKYGQKIKGKPTKGKVLILHKITRPNSLKIVLSGVANCHNLSFGGRATRRLTGASSNKGKCAESPPTFI